MSEILEFDNEPTEDESENKTDLELGKTHGYEGSFKIGDRVKVKGDIRLWHVKAYSDKGFIAKDFTGTVVGLALYGRKYATLCSAITPIKVEFLPDGEGVTPG